MSDAEIAAMLDDLAERLIRWEQSDALAETDSQRRVMSFHKAILFDGHLKELHDRLLVSRPALAEALNREYQAAVAAIESSSEDHDGSRLEAALQVSSFKEACWTFAREIRLGGWRQTRAKAPREPSEVARQAYALYHTAEGWSQERIAEELTRLYKKQPPYSQGQISKMIQRVRDFRRSMGLPFETAARVTVTPVDPATEDMGERTDGKITGHPRNGRDDDDES